MKIRLLALPVLLLLLPGCLIGHEREGIYNHRACNGNEYWDGHQCRVSSGGKR